VATQSVPKITEDEYLRLDRAADCRSEFVDGEMFAMSGGSLRHAMLPVNWATGLVAQLRSGNCRVFSSDMRTRISARGAYVYPDLSVVCGQPKIHEGSADILTNPKVVIEILSPSTADYDRGKKFELYREIPSLDEYVLTHQDSPHIEHYARQPDSSWIFREYRGIESSIELLSIGCKVQLADIYAGVLDLPQV
jgi:Uma2 family endonuclease